MKRLLPIFIACLLLHTTIVYSQDTNCQNVTFDITDVNGNPVFTIDDAPNCYQNLPFTLVPSTTTGTFEDIPGLLEGSTSYKPIIENLSMPSHITTFTYRDGNNLCIKTIEIIFPTPLAEIQSPIDNSPADNTIEVCASDLPIPLSGNRDGDSNANFFLNGFGSENFISDSLVIDDLNNGVNTLYYIYSDTTGCTSTDMMTIIKNPPPTFDCPDVFDGMTVCNTNSPINLTSCQSARLTGPLVNLNSTLLDPTLAAPDATYEHYITYLGNDCYADVVDTIQINVISEPRLAFESIGNACVDPFNGTDTLVYTGDDVGPNAQFTWNLQDGTVISNQNDTVIVSWNSAGDKNVDLTIENSYCGSLSISETIIKEGVTLSVSANENPIFLGEEVELSSDANSSSGSTLSYFWSPLDNLLSPNSPNTVGVPDTTTTYQLVVTDANGCTAVDSITITVVPDTRIFVPNVFTPNNDGQHDSFVITDNKIEDQGRLTIFDRWGGKVYETQDLRTGWDGMVNGKFVTTGVYVYVLEVTFKDGAEEVRHGNVTVIR